MVAGAVGVGPVVAGSLGVGVGVWVEAGASTVTFEDDATTAEPTTSWTGNDPAAWDAPTVASTCAAPVPSDVPDRPSHRRGGA